MIICPKCGSVLSYNSCFRLYICDKCNWEGKREPLKTTKITTKTSCIVKRSFLTIVLFIIIFSCSSCSSPFSFSKTSSTTTSLSSNYKLNKRQKSILKREGLPTDYNKLNVTQKSSIEAIETLLCYLEDKYPDEYFEYSGYVGVTLNPMDKEHLIAFSDYGEVIVYREYINDKVVITDNFCEVKAGDLYAAIVNKYVDTLVDDSKFCVSVKVNKLVGDKWKTKPFESCNAYVEIYFDETIGKKTYEETINKTLSYFGRKAKRLTTINFTLVKKDKFYIYVMRQFADDDSFSIYDFVKKEIYFNTEKALSVFTKE